MYGVAHAAEGNSATATIAATITIAQTRAANRWGEMLACGVLAMEIGCPVLPEMGCCLSWGVA